MLVSISGPQGSGKSTLIQSFLTQFPDVQTIDRKTSRSVLLDMNMTLDDVYKSPHNQQQFQLALLNRKHEDELDAISDDRLWITERSYSDLFTYTLGYLGKHNELDDWMNLYYDKCSLYQKDYSVVLYLCGGKFDVEDDGLRPINKHYANMVDLLTYYYVNEMNRNSVYSITGVNINNRTERMTQILTGMKLI